jgi:lysophospholipase L1-like esterase
VDEAAYAAALARGFAAIRAAGARAVAMDAQRLPAPRDPARYARFLRLTAEAAAAGGAALFPRHAVMAGWDDATLAAMLAPDGLHHGDRGYACLAALLAAALTEAAE